MSRPIYPATYNFKGDKETGNQKSHVFRIRKLQICWYKCGLCGKLTITTSPIIIINTDKPYICKKCFNPAPRFPTPIFST